MTQTSPAASRVRARLVLFFSGFDPQGPRHYHRMYEREATAQATVNGYRIQVGDRRSAGPLVSRWQVQASTDEAPEGVTTEYQFMRWEDLVRANWPERGLGVAMATLTSTARIIANGMLWRSLQGSWPAFLALSAPSVVVSGVLILAALLAWGAWRVADAGMLPYSLLLLVGGGVLLWRVARWAEAKAQMAWLMRSMRYVLRQARGQTPELEARIDAFAAHVLASVDRTDHDELLLVGHSSGVMMAISALARAIEQRPSLATGPARISLLTLGQSTPILSFQPEAHRFRGELAQLAQATAIDWVDFTAPSDACCSALLVPTRVSFPPPGAPWTEPKMLSARFPSLFTPDRYRSIRRDKYRCHFQYLMASELPGRYDYFGITAGPQTLADRYADLPSLADFKQFQMFGGPWRKQADR